MLVVFGALLPVVLLLCLGYGARAVGGIPLMVWPALERLTYYVLIPFFLVHALGHQAPDVRTIGSLASGVLGVSMVVILVLWSVPFLRPGLDRAVFTSVFQGSVRANTFIGLGVAEGLWGRPGLVLVAATAGLTIILFNVLCVGTLSVALVRVRGQGRLVREMSWALLRNPLIWSCLLGWAVGAGWIPLPVMVMDSLGMIGRAAVPMALLVAGAGLKFGPAGSRWSGEIAASVLKLLVMPAGGFLVTHFMGLEGMVRAVVILMPAPPSAYVLACQMGGDAPLMARIISLQMILSFFTLPVTVFLADMV